MEQSQAPASFVLPSAADLLARSSVPRDPWWSASPARGTPPSAPRAPATADSLVTRLAALRTWEWQHVPQLRRRVSAEVFHAVWLLAGVAHDTPFTLKCVAAHARAGNRSVRATLGDLRRDGWIEPVPSTGDRRLRPLRATTKLVDLLSRYEVEVERVLRGAVDVHAVVER